MLSFIYQLANDYERGHGLRPNTLYLSRDHLQHLTDSFSQETTLEQIIDILDMEIILDESALHPRASWMNRIYSRAM